MKLTLCVDGMSTIRWWVDASHQVHSDMKGQVGCMMSMNADGMGALISGSHKMKLNTPASTVTELCGTHDALPKIMWSKYFIEAQGYTVDQNILYQDNEAALRLEVNGRLSSTKRTKHIHARYFLIKDHVDRGEIEPRHCPTHMMWCDMQTKPKQGKAFKVDRSHLMNVPEDYDDAVERRQTNPKLLAFESKTSTYKPPPMPDWVPPKPSSVKPRTAAKLPRRSVLEDTTNGTSTVGRERVRKGRGRGRGRKIRQTEELVFTPSRDKRSGRSQPPTPF